MEIRSTEMLKHTVELAKGETKERWEERRIDWC